MNPEQAFRKWLQKFYVRTKRSRTPVSCEMDDDGTGNFYDGNGNLVGILGPRAMEMLKTFTPAAPDLP